MAQQIPGVALKAAVFDLGNVLIDFDVLYAARRLARLCPYSAQEIVARLFGHPVVTAFEKGDIAPRDFWDQARLLIGSTAGYDDFLPLWNEMFFMTQANRALHTLAGELGRRLSLAVLSNTNVLHVEYLKEHYGIFDIFPRVLTSCELHMTKPDIRIYEKTVELLGCGAGEVFYVDDRPDFIASARTLGIRAFVYNGPEQVRDDLAACGVVLPLPERYRRNEP